MKKAMLSRMISKRPPGPQHVLAKPTKQPVLVPNYSKKNRAFIAGEG